MTIPIILGLVAVLLVVVLATTMRGRGTPTAAGRQSGLIVIVLLVGAGLVLYYVFGR